MTDKIDIFDRKTSLSKLRDVLDWHTTPENVASLVMILCQRIEARIEALEKRIEELEKDDKPQEAQND